MKRKPRLPSLRHSPFNRYLLSRAASGIAIQIQSVAVGRLGGEEFAAVLPVSHAAEAAAVAERVGATLAAQPIMFGQVRIDVTVSIGLAAMPADGAHFDALMSAADRAHYSAKLSGRNQTRTEDTAFSRLGVPKASGLAY